MRGNVSAMGNVFAGGCISNGVPCKEVPAQGPG